MFVYCTLSVVLQKRSSVLSVSPSYYLQQLFITKSSSILSLLYCQPIHVTKCEVDKCKLITDNQTNSNYHPFLKKRDIQKKFIDYRYCQHRNAENIYWKLSLLWGTSLQSLHTVKLSLASLLRAEFSNKLFCCPKKNNEQLQGFWLLGTWDILHLI